MTGAGGGGGRRLAGHLLRTGWAAGRAAQGGRLRFVSLSLASLVLAIGLMALMCTAAVYDGRTRRDQARSPLPAGHGRAAVALWAEGGDTIDRTPVGIIEVVPLDPAAPPPPGLSRWPRPGEAFLSPALADRAPDQHVATRYGRFAGRIAASGLASPAELFVYVHPANADVTGDGWQKIAGFGSEDWSPIGERLDAWPMIQVLATVGGLTGLPCLALVVVAARCGSSARDRRGALLQVLGAGRRHRALVTIGEAAPPALLGATAAGLLTLPLMIMDTPLPVTGYVVGKADVRAWAWAVPLVVAASFLLVLALAVVTHRVDRTGRATRPRSFASRVPKWRIAVFAGSVAGIVVSGGVPGLAGLLLYIASTVAMWASLPSVAAAVSRRFGGAVAVTGWRGGSPTRLIAGRWISAHPGVIVRLATALVIGLGLITQIQVWTSRLNEPARAAVETEHRVGDRVLLVDVSDASRGQVQRFLRGIPQDSGTLWLSGAEDGRPVTLTGTCPALRRVGLRCPDRPTAASLQEGDARAQELARWWAADESGLWVQAVPESALRDGARPVGRITQLVVFSDRQGDGWRVQQAAYAVFGFTADGLGIEYGGSAASLMRLGQWVVLFGGAGIVVLMLAAATSAAAEFLRFSDALAPLAVQTDRRSVYASVAFWNLTVPLWLATIVGGAVTAWHGLFFIAQVQEGRFSWGALGAAMGVAATLALLVGLAGGAGASRAARRWRPVND
ncbi:hypothetical protein [Actinomadura litoris]|uniref:hypothetical protein n=1 Tax=Actinomadura litoris TaxID=2678616 RepID=UPI001FA6F007|nr:hypothetical protein [Actinomadura litoris]